MHREPGHARFFALLAFFAHGMLLLSSAQSLELLLIGWEIVGITSFLLIGFFHERNAPVSNALHAFITYRICDVGLLFAVAMLNHWHVTGVQDATAIDTWATVANHLGSVEVTVVALLVLFAAIGKSALFPAGGWLPRAMEGPTPSSAIFYGGLSVHAGIYLLIRAAPFFEASPVARYVVLIVAVVTALWSTLVGRVQSDAKNALAYAIMTQCGVMAAEVALGFSELALLHLVGHACLRTWQLLRTPSALHEVHLMHAAVGGHVPATGRHLELLIPEGARRVLYRYAIHGFHLEHALYTICVRPIFWLAQQTAMMEESYAQMFDRPQSDTSESDGNGARDGFSLTEVQGANQP